MLLSVWPALVLAAIVSGGRALRAALLPLSVLVHTSSVTQTTFFGLLEHFCLERPPGRRKPCHLPSSGQFDTRLDSRVRSLRFFFSTRTACAVASCARGHFGEGKGNRSAASPALPFAVFVTRVRCSQFISPKYQVAITDLSQFALILLLAFLLVFYNA